MAEEDKKIDGLASEATTIQTNDWFHLNRGGTDMKVKAQQLINLLPSGPQGDPGPQGVQGPQGSIGPAGPSNLYTLGSGNTPSGADMVGVRHYDGLPTQTTTIDGDLAAYLSNPVLNGAAIGETLDLQIGGFDNLAGYVIRDGVTVANYIGTYDDAPGTLVFTEVDGSGVSFTVDISDVSPMEITSGTVTNTGNTVQEALENAANRRSVFYKCDTVFFPTVLDSDNPAASVFADETESQNYVPIPWFQKRKWLEMEADFQVTGSAENRLSAYTVYIGETNAYGVDTSGWTLLHEETINFRFRADVLDVYQDGDDFYASIRVTGFATRDDGSRNSKIPEVVTTLLTETFAWNFGVGLVDIGYGLGSMTATKIFAIKQQFGPHSFIES